MDTQQQQQQDQCWKQLSALLAELTDTCSCCRAKHSRLCLEDCCLHNQLFCEQCSSTHFLHRTARLDQSIIPNLPALFETERSQLRRIKRIKKNIGKRYWGTNNTGKEGRHLTKQKCFAELKRREDAILDELKHLEVEKAVFEELRSTINLMYLSIRRSQHYLDLAETLFQFPDLIDELRNFQRCSVVQLILSSAHGALKSDVWSVDEQVFNANCPLHWYQTRIVTFSNLNHPVNIHKEINYFDIPQYLQLGIWTESPMQTIKWIPLTVKVLRLYWKKRYSQQEEDHVLNLVYSLKHLKQLYLCCSTLSSKVLSVLVRYGISNELRCLVVTKREFGTPWKNRFERNPKSRIPLLTPIQECNTCYRTALTQSTMLERHSRLRRMSTVYKDQLLSYLDEYRPFSSLQAEQGQEKCT